MAFLFLPCLYSCLWFVSHSVSPCKNEVNVVLVTIVIIIFIIVVVAIIILIVIIITFVIIMIMTTRARTGILAGNHNSRVESSANGDINIIIIIAITLSINPPQLKQEITLRYDQLCLLCHLDLVYCLPLPAPNCQTGQK